MDEDGFYSRISEIVSDEPHTHSVDTAQAAVEEAVHRLHRLRHASPHVDAMPSEPARNSWEDIEDQAGVDDLRQRMAKLRMMLAVNAFKSGLSPPQSPSGSTAPSSSTAAPNAALRRPHHSKTPASSPVLPSSGPSKLMEAASRLRRDVKSLSSPRSGAATTTGSPKEALRLSAATHRRTSSSTTPTTTTTPFDDAKQEAKRGPATPWIPPTPKHLEEEHAAPPPRSSGSASHLPWDTARQRSSPVPSSSAPVLNTPVGDAAINPVDSRIQQVLQGGSSLLGQLRSPLSTTQGSAGLSASAATTTPVSATDLRSRLELSASRSKPASQPSTPAAPASASSPATPARHNLDFLPGLRSSTTPSGPDPQPTGSPLGSDSNQPEWARSTPHRSRPPSKLAPAQPIPPPSTRSPSAPPSPTNQPKPPTDVVAAVLSQMGPTDQAALRRVMEDAGATVAPPAAVPTAPPTAAPTAAAATAAAPPAAAAPTVEEEEDELALSKHQRDLLLRTLKPTSSVEALINAQRQMNALHPQAGDADVSSPASRMSTPDKAAGADAGGGHDVGTSSLSLPLTSSAPAKSTLHALPAQDHLLHTFGLGGTRFYSDPWGEGGSKATAPAPAPTPVPPRAGPSQRRVPHTSPQPASRPSAGAVAPRRRPQPSSAAPSFSLPPATTTGTPSVSIPPPVPVPAPAPTPLSVQDASTRRGSNRRPQQAPPALSPMRFKPPPAAPIVTNRRRQSQKQSPVASPLSPESEDDDDDDDSPLVQLRSKSGEAIELQLVEMLEQRWREAHGPM